MKFVMVHVGIYIKYHNRGIATANAVTAAVGGRPAVSLTKQKQFD